ncbi:MAG: hypothetical protein GX786_04575 [Clostridiales bacterium]|nr:hypothetical protein [Clostridiales bacterium]
MKKWTSILLTMMIMLTCVLMGFAEEEHTAKIEGPINLEDPSTYLGDWYLVTMEYDGLAMNVVDLGINITLTLNEDGSATMLAEDDDEPQLMNWEINSKGLEIGEGEDRVVAQIEEGVFLVLEEEGTKLVYQREVPVAEEGDFEDSPIVQDSEEDFLGSWTLQLLESEGIRLPADSLGMEVTMTISADAIHMNIMGEIKAKHGR